MQDRDEFDVDEFFRNIETRKDLSFILELLLWNQENPTGTYGELPDELLEKLLEEIDTQDPDEEKEMHFIMGVFLAICRTHENVYNEELSINEDEMDSLVLNWFLTLDWYEALLFQGTLTALDEVKVFDSKFFKGLDTEKVEREVENIYKTLSKEKPTLS